MSLTRRHYLAAGLLLPWLPRVLHAAPDVLGSSRTLMGTSVDIVVRAADPQQRDTAVRAAYAEMERLESMMTRYSQTSRVAALHLASGLQPVEVPRELMGVLRRAQQVSLASDGAFDATVGAYAQWSFAPGQAHLPSAREIARERPLVNFADLVLDQNARTAFLRRRGMRIDLGGVAKLPILEAGLQVLQRHGIAQAMINGGGDVGVIGGSVVRPWRVGVRDPRAPQRLLGVLQLTNGWVASSGDYERYFEQGGRRYHHVLDPRTGYPTQGPRGVVIVSDSTEQISGLGAAMMVTGWRRGQSLLPSGAKALLVERDGAVRTTANWESLRMASAPAHA